VESFPRYVALVRKRGPEPYWTPVAPVHRLVSYFLSWTYCALGMTPFAVTLLGLLAALVGFALMACWPWGQGPFWVGLALVNLGVVHDACDGEVARWRLHHKLQSTATYRVGMFADFWAYAVVVQALWPVALGFVAWRRDARLWGHAVGAVAFALGLAAAFLLLSSYVVGFARRAYWPGRGKGVEEESLSLATGGPLWLRVARKAYFYTFETAMFTTHATLLLVLWTWLGGGTAPWWGTVYVLAVAAALALAFLVGTAQAFAAFDREA